MAGLTGDSDGTGDLAVELSKTDPACLETGQDSEDDSGEPEDWVPDPVDADPGQFTYWTHSAFSWASLVVYWVLVMYVATQPWLFQKQPLPQTWGSEVRALFNTSWFVVCSSLATLASYRRCLCGLYPGDQIAGKSAYSVIWS